ncbi:helix-turn-helix domain-containing protein [Lysinibacillus piscis]|uniref:Helix-turn-helix domain containing protein n=1 Tax=Lysinibacillus piscis TaxID=2518931 RepID=A0ABQ5NJZ6_9BACI|nr:helix-turn-helix domain-containing protein [Lysinibacillus sp. KH24]GLC88678.1 hypothetical protein LYSBPC_18050 [Lysinibacillus sp. KH24]
MKGMRERQKRYILFTGEAHENMKFDFTQHEIDKFISLWDEGIPIAKIAKKFGINTTNAGLVVMDLHMAGKLKERTTGVFGSK